VPQKAQGAGVTYDSEVQGPTTRYTNVAYALGYIVTHEELMDDLYEAVSKTRASALARSFRQTKERVGAGVYNRAETSGYTGGDGVTLLSASHPLTSGGTASNKLAVAADLSEAAIEDLCIDTDAWFVRTNVPNGMKYFEREAMKFDQDNDFDTMNAKAKGYERYVFGWTDWRGVFGSMGG
jgi:hypothetical protein